MFPLDVLAEPLWQRLTWTLFHFLWQGLAVVAVVATLLYVWPLRRAGDRYLIYVSALVAMAACPLVTFMVVEAPESTRAARGGVEREASLPRPAEGELEPVASETGIGRTGRVAREGQPPLDQAQTASPAVGSPDLARSDVEDLAVPRVPATWEAGLRRCIDAIQPYALMGWIAGVLLLAVRLSLSWMHVRWLAWSRRAIPADLAARAAGLGRRLRLRFPPRVCVSEKIREAIVVGLWRPLVLLPASWLAEMPPEVLEAVIAHELAHVRRLDLWVNLLQRLIETLLFYHPAVWWLSRRVGLEREMCADELAVGATRERLGYATALEQLGRMRLGQTLPQLGAGIGGKRMVLLNRVANILGMSGSTKRARWWPAGLLALAVPLAIWLASTSIVSSTENETSAEQGEASTSVKLDKADLKRWVEKANSPVQSEFDAAVDALVAMGPGVAPAMIPLLKTGRTDRLGLKVLQSLASEPSVQQILVKAIEEARDNRVPNVVHCALIALGKSGNVAHVDFIAAFLETNDIAATSALATLGGERARDHLIGAFDIVATERWFMLAGALQRLGDPAAVPELKKRLAQVELPPNERFPPATVAAMTGAISSLSGEKETFTTTCFCQGQRFRYPFGRPGLPKTFSVNPLRDHYVRLPKVDPESKAGREAIWKAMEEATDGPGFTIDGNEVVAFHGLKMAPLWPDGRPYPTTLYDWLRQTSHQVLRRLIDQENQTGRCAIPKSGLLVTLDPAGRLYVLSLKRTSDQFTYDVTVMPQDPNMQLIPVGADAEDVQLTEIAGCTLYDLESETRDGSLNLSRGHLETMTPKKWQGKNTDAVLVVEFANNGTALAVPGAERFLLAEAGDAWEKPEKALALLRAAAKEEPTIPGHRTVKRDGAIFHAFPELAKGRKFAFAVKMPDGNPVAGMFEVRTVDWNAETLRIRHRFLPTAAAWKVFAAPDASAQGAPARAKIVSRTANETRAKGVFDGASIAGRVTHAAGKPVAGALVEWGHYQDPPAAWQQTTTDGEGRYRLELTEFGVGFRLGVSAPNMAPRWQVLYADWVHLSEPVRDEDAIPPKRMDFQLEPMHWIAGTVVDQSGKPIEGVRISARTAVEGGYSSFSSPTASMLLPGKGPYETETDAAGRFRLVGLPAKHVRLQLAAAHRHVNDGNYSVDQEHRIAMRGSGRPGIIRPRVVDGHTGKPVEQFNVARRYDPKQREIKSADGRFLWDDVHTEGNNYRFYVYSKDYAPAAVDIRAVPSDSQEETVIKLSPGNPLVATLVDAQSGKPLAGVPVLYAVVEEDDRYFLWSDRDSYIDGHHGLTLVQRAVTDDDGGFWFSETDDAPSGTLFVITPGYERMILRPEGRPTPSDSKPVRIGLHREASITGVLAMDGRPEPDVNVSIWKSEPRSRLEEFFEAAVTDSQGRYRFGSLGPGTYSLAYEVRLSRTTFTSKTFATATLARDEQRFIEPIAADDDDPGDTSVNVADSPKVTVDLINAVGIQERPSFWIGRERLAREALLDRLGELRDKSPALQVAVRHTALTGEKELSALRQSLARLNIRDVSIGRHDLPHVFAYASGKYDGTIRGRVIDPHPTVPSPKYHVMLWHKNFEFQGGVNPALVVGAGEAFEFRNLGPGDYELRTREWRPNGRVVHFGADWTYIQTKAAVEDGKVTEVQVVFGEGETGRWSDAYTYGEAADGVIMHVTRAKFTIAPGERIDLHVDVYNGGNTDRKIVLNHKNWDLEIDGRWIKESGGASSGRAVYLLKPKQGQHNVDIWSWLGENMTRAVEGLPPGKHTLRVAHLLEGEGRSSEGSAPIRVVSQPVIIEVVAEDESEGIGAAESPGVEPEAGRAVPPGKTTVRGNVVDDATGKPVAGFVTEGGKFDPADPAKVVWGYSETRSSAKDGRFSTTVRWAEGWTARIVAAGYLPQPVLTEPPSPGQAAIEVVIRLKRGGTVRGRVLDHAGKPVAGAGVYLAGRGVIDLAEGPWGEFQGPSVRTDAEGRFEIGGLGSDSKAIFVTAPSLYVWRSDLPQPGEEAMIRLPEPATLHIRYDIEGGPPAAQVRIELRTWEMPEWKALVDVVRWVDVKAGEDGFVVDNLPPGVYDISRVKHTRAGNSGKDMLLDRQLKLTLASGKTATYDFVRKKGMPISGDVVGLPEQAVGGVFLYVRDQRASGDPRSRDDWMLPTFDGLALEGNGPFKTERIPPGKHKVVVEAYRQETRGEMTQSGWRLPKWIGTAVVDVPESGEPPKVRVMMRSYDAR